MDTKKIKIHTFGHKGVGIGEIDGKKIFVPKVGKDDVCTITIQEEKRYFSFAKLETIVTPSPIRIPSACPVFSQCGGCDYQFLKYEDELKIKEELVRNQLKRIGKILIEEPLTIISSEPNYYRNKAKFHRVQNALGFYDLDYTILEIPECNIIDKKILKSYELVRAEKKLMHENNLDYIIIRSSRNEDKTLINFVSYPHTKITLDENLQKKLLEHCSSINLSSASEKDENIVSVYASYGSDHIMESISHVRYMITPTSFFQVNPYVTEFLYEHLKTFINKDDIVFDLYSGSGAIALYLAAKAKKIIGVDISRENIVLAEHLQKENHLENAIFYTGKSERYLKKLIARYKKCDSLILDPPRSGCDTMLLKHILEFSIPQILYVSCNPATLARDLALLATKYTIDKITLFDMFPRTHHVEVVAVLKL